MATRKKTRTARPKAARKSASKSRQTTSRAPRAKAAAAFRPTSDAASLTVNDIAASLAWYCDVIGFAVKQRWEQNGRWI